jgi:hypothetical protein
MLEDHSEKFYRPGERYETLHRATFYTNYRMFFWCAPSVARRAFRNVLCDGTGIVSLQLNFSFQPRCKRHEARPVRLSPSEYDG